MTTLADPGPTRVDPARVLRVARQHLETTSLMGVDFVPRRAREEHEPPVPIIARTVTDEGQVRTPTKPEPSPLLPARAGAGLTEFVRPTRSQGEDDAIYKARALAALRARYEADAPHAEFVTAFTNIVFHDGDPCARLCFVGEAPGEDEDRTGVPFVGRAGQLLNKMIKAMGITRESVYICNVLKTRPPNNATPTAKEAAACEPYLLEQLAIVAPEVIVTLGLPATRLLLKSEETMSRMRGRWAAITLPGGLSVPVMPTYHPAFLLRSYTPENRQKVWEDLQLVMTRLGLKPGAAPAG